jgi:hypothetical protein
VSSSESSPLTSAGVVVKGAADVVDEATFETVCRVVGEVVFENELLDNTVVEATLAAVLEATLEEATEEEATLEVATLEEATEEVLEATTEDAFELALAEPDADNFPTPALAKTYFGTSAAAMGTIGEPASFFAIVASKLVDL